MREGPETRIERREFKYLISHEVAAGVRDALRPFCELDRHSAVAPGHRYIIESLYFDTPSWALFHANEQELLDRFKLRVRRYPGAGDRVFFEVKRRYHDVILKTRGAVAADVWPRLLADPWFPRALMARDPAVERFVTLVHTHHAAPVALVSYAREAWTSLVDDYARVTFDTRIQSQQVPTLSFDSDPRGWRANDDPESQGISGDSAVVLELKFTANAPTWMMHLVQRMSLWRRSFSKYGTSILTWNTAPGRRVEVA
ncbi:MAG: VTC domain-containing protein [Deltaproteobacteria bacterium HGW-Deltaproteobacteria-14]|nr:MAG: VTC domain-containing protein [Deltaproteobacteria bacterium HGW-Deltaproteobacteria-14]